eukprot:6173215-Pleurochrysis_carterae.AAC.4
MFSKGTSLRILCIFRCSESSRSDAGLLLHRSCRLQCPSATTSLENAGGEDAAPCGGNGRRGDWSMRLGSYSCSEENAPWAVVAPAECVPTLGE